MDGGSHGDTQIRVDLASRVLAEGVSQPIADERCSGRATHQQNFVNLGGGKRRRFERGMNGVQRVFDEGPNHVLVLFAR